MWLDALEAEAAVWRARFGGRVHLRTLYVGGGTPSLLPEAAWRRLLSIITDLADLSCLAEATVEANPSSLSRELLSLWRDGGVTRVSLGVQSLNDDELRSLGRLHNAAGALRAMELVLKAGFSLSADLIFGLPGQTLGAWDASLRGVLAAGVGHLSCYQLTLEPDTTMGRRAPGLPDGYPLYRYTQWFLPKKDFLQYEISSFAPQGAECRHNLAYWRQEDVLALGPAAWGYLGGLRYANPGTLEEYFAASRRGFQGVLEAGERLSRRGRAVEAAILLLRTRWGIDRADFVRRWGQGISSEVRDVLKKIPPHLVRMDAETAALTPEGMRVGNSIWAELMELMSPEASDDAQKEG